MMRHAGPIQCLYCEHQTPYDPDWTVMSAAVVAHMEQVHPHTSGLTEDPRDKAARNQPGDTEVVEHLRKAFQLAFGRVLPDHEFQPCKIYACRDLPPHCDYPWCGQSAAHSSHQQSPTPAFTAELFGELHEARLRRVHANIFRAIAEMETAEAVAKTKRLQKLLREIYSRLSTAYSRLPTSEKPGRLDKKFLAAWLKRASKLLEAGRAKPSRPSSR